MTDTLDDGASTGPAQTADDIVPEPSEVDDSREAGRKERNATAFAPPARRWYQAPLVATLVGFLAVFLSLTPSLVPRSGLTQGIVSGVAFAIGYALGVLGAWAVRQFTKWHADAATTRVLWMVMGVIILIGGAVMLWRSSMLQGRILQMMDQSAPTWKWFLWATGAAFGVAVILIGLGRLFRRAARALGRLFSRWMPTRTARGMGRIVVAVVAVAVVMGVMWPGLKLTATGYYGNFNYSTAAGTTNPNSNYTSGGPASAMSWESLGSPGRDFISQVTTQQQLQSFSGKTPTKEPIRVYSGIDIGNAQQRADAAVKDLQSMGAFDRKILAVVTSTGTGWVDPQAVDPLEYMYNGDSAIVSTQYSILPSWMAVVAGGNSVQEAAVTLFESVYAEWTQLPRDKRPALVIFGESLGSEGMQAAFSGPADIANRTDAALFAGPPDASEPWKRMVENRDPGSPEILPIYQDGKNVRFAGQPSDMANPTTPWDAPRAIYLMNASDPVVWFSPSLLYKEPAWLKEPRGRGVLPELKWMPVVTCLQLVGDLMAATGYPAGFGHSYAENQVDAWAAIIGPPGWTQAETDKLRAIIANTASGV